MLYIAADGNYGNAENIAIVNNESFDEHFYDYLENLSDYMKVSYAEWFADNSHDLEQNPDSAIEECLECEDWIAWVKA
jgi:hypothetical protein